MKLQSIVMSLWYKRGSIFIKNEISLCEDSSCYMYSVPKQVHSPHELSLRSWTALGTPL